MTDNSKKLSQLPIAANVASTDRVLILRDPSGSPSTRTITVNNFISTMPVANSTQFGVVKVGTDLSVNATGYLNATQGLPEDNRNYGYTLSIDDSGNVVWSAFSGVYSLKTINDTTTYTATATDTVLLVDPNAVDANIEITLPLNGNTVQGKQYIIKNINAGANHVVKVTTESAGSNYLENPDTGIFVIDYNIANTGDCETWVFDSYVYRHIGSKRV